MKWIHIKGNMYKCPACGTRFTIGKKWKCCPVCEQELSGVEEQSMSDYIKREDALQTLLKRKQPSNGADNTKERWRYIQWLVDYNTIADFPPADVTEVVRCKDCKWWNGIECQTRDIDVVDDDEYCSYGEREDGESDE